METTITDNIIHQRIAMDGDVVTKGLAHGEVEVIVSTPRRDHYEEVVDIKGMDLSEYNGVVLWGHNGFAPPIGKSLVTKKIDGQSKVYSKTQFALKEYEFADTIYKLVVGGYITDVSVGFRATDIDLDTMTWTKSKMVEYSYVTIGANPDAKITSKSFEDLGLTEHDIKAQHHDFVVKFLETSKATASQELEHKQADGLQADVEALRTKVLGLEAELLQAKSIVMAPKKRTLYVVTNSDLADRSSTTVTATKRVTLKG